MKQKTAVNNHKMVNELMLLKHEIGLDRSWKEFCISRIYNLMHLLNILLIFYYKIIKFEHIIIIKINPPITTQGKLVVKMELIS